MNTAARLVISLSPALLASPLAWGWHFDYRFIERVGTTDTVVGNGATFPATPGAIRRLRIQFGVFDDATSAAPAGGFIGWSLGTITDSGGVHNQRTPGRLANFDFIVGGNGSPASDPFQFLTAVDASLGPQTFNWDIDANGMIPPMPAPTIRGLNTFVSVFELSTTPGLSSYTITVGGSLFAASSWAVFASTPPSNNNTPMVPGDDTPGSVSYAPTPLPPQAFVLPPLVLNIQVPAPAGGVALATLAALAGTRRRRTDARHTS
ncbi:MAG: hypothetical protein H7210_01175 [Pyrinomonadaceae bacterium]|nr:hypothetical protein [Phycisphaerales bacterium]